MFLDSRTLPKVLLNPVPEVFLLSNRVGGHIRTRDPDLILSALFESCMMLEKIQDFPVHVKT